MIFIIRCVMWVFLILFALSLTLSFLIMYLNELAILHPQGKIAKLFDRLFR
jgi:hypothetical protein